VSIKINRQWIIFQYILQPSRTGFSLLCTPSSASLVLTLHIPLSNFFPSGSMSLTSNISSNNINAIVGMFILINTHRLSLYSYLLMQRCSEDGCSDKLIIDVCYTSEYCMCIVQNNFCVGVPAFDQSRAAYLAPACAM